jgi:hypothetical protein
VRAALKEIATSAPADIRVAAHFTKVTRGPVAATESFKAMARELQARGRGVGLALWAANNHPIAFGDPTGTAGPGLTRKDIAGVTRPLTPHRDRADSDENSTYRIDPVVRAQHFALQEARRQATTERRARDIAPYVARSFELHASRIEKVIPTDPHAEEHAAHIRAIAHSSIAGDGQAPGDPRRAQMTRPDTDKTRRYAEMHEQIVCRDQARGRDARRNDREDHGRMR